MQKENAKEQFSSAFVEFEKCISIECCILKILNGKWLDL